MARKKWTAVRLGETGPASGTGTESRKETGIEKETGTADLEEGGGHSAIHQVEEGEAAIEELMGGNGSEDGRRTVGVGTERETEIARETETVRETGTEIDGTGKRDVAAWRVSGEGLRTRRERERMSEAVVEEEVEEEEGKRVGVEGVQV